MSLRNLPKIILITGGDMNNIDKGIIPASIGVLLKANGYNITVVKMDPCFNRNSINLDPSKYGEKYSLDDGEIVSINFGYYERILGQIFTKHNYITRGKIDDYVNNQNEIKYTGDKIRSVNVVAAILECLEKVFNQTIDDRNPNKPLPDICIIELGGADNEISDKKFLKALSEFKEVKKNFIHIHISKLICGKTGFLETSIKMFRKQNWLPELIICRSENPISDVFKKCLAKIADIEIEKVINLPEVSNIKSVAIILQEQNIYQIIAEKLQLKNGPNFDENISKLKKDIEKADSYTKVVKIALVGKYFNHPCSSSLFLESYESMVQQLKIAAADKKCSCKVEILFVRGQDLENKDSDEMQKAQKLLEEANGILIPGGLGSDGFEGLMKACKYARENKKPLLSICYGMQCAVIEFAQNIIGIHAGESYKKALKKVNIEMPENGNPRRGARTVTFLTKNSKLFELYGCKPFIKERNWNRMEINPSLVPSYISAGLRFVAVGFDENESGEISETLQNLMSRARIHDEVDEKGYIKTMNKLCKYSRETHTALRMQAMELKDHPFYIGIQYHAKFGLSPSMPSPPFIGLIQAALHEKEASETIQTISNDSKSEAKVLKKKKDATCKFEYFIKCKDPIENGIFKISSLERFLKAKLQNLVNDVRVERSKIVISSEKKFSKHYLKYLTKKFLKKESLHESIKVISSAKNTFDLCCFSSDKSDDSDDSDED